jgi:predicted RNase H-like HicB family nuclease
LSRSCDGTARSKAVASDAYTYTVAFEPDEETGGYTVTCPALPGLITEGDTLEQARTRAAGAILCYLESLRKDGLPLPLSEVHDVEPIRESLAVDEFIDLL